MSISKVCVPMVSSSNFPYKVSKLYQNTRRFSKKPSPSDHEFDIAVIGGGIVGCASARELLKRHPTLKIALVDKEFQFANHQSGNNSGVIHAGIYYKPGSLKAKLCVQGSQLAYKYMDEKDIPYSRCGKLIVATQRAEIPRLLDLYDRGIKNGVKDIKLLDYKGMNEIVPNCQGLQGLWSPNTGILDWGEVTRSYAEDFKEKGGKTYLNFEVKRFTEAETGAYPIIITDEKTNTIKAKFVLTCCGLQSDTIAVLTGCSEDPKIIPFRGEYLYLAPQKQKQIKTNIYPVPDPRFPFLGVHLTPKLDGRVIIGPNAIMALCKEGYTWTDFNWKELKDIITYPGFRKMALKYATFGMKEMLKSAIIPLQMRTIQQYVHGLTAADVVRGPAGVRAQALDRDGTLVEDFVFDSSPGSGAIGSRILHCRNAPSPGATSALAIAKMIADKMADQFNLNSKVRIQSTI